MAYIVDDENEEEKAKGQEQNNGLNQVPAGAGGGLIQGGAQSASETPAQKSPQGSGAFTNLQKYLDANQDQTAGLANQVGGVVRDKATSAVSAADQAAQNFQTQLQQQRVQYDKNLLDSFVPKAPPPPAPVLPAGTYGVGAGGGRAYGVQPPTGVITTPEQQKANKLADTGQDPLSRYLDSGNESPEPVRPGVAPNSLTTTQTRNVDYSALTQAQKDAIKAARTQQYGGPNSIEETGLLTDARGQANEAQQMADMANSEPGRFTLLEKTVNSPTYTRGMKRLDQGLLAASPGARDEFAKLKTDVGGLYDQIGSKASQANQYIDTVKGDLASDRDYVNSTLQKAIQGELSGLDSRVSQAGEKLNTDYTKWKDLFGQDPSLQNDELYKIVTGGTGHLGNTPYAPEKYGIDLGQFVQKSGSPDRSLIANESDAQALSALADLAGESNNYLASDQVGKYNPNITLDRDNYIKQVMDKLDAYDRQSSLRFDVGKKAGNANDELDYMGALGSMRNYFGKLAKGGGGNEYNGGDLAIEDFNQVVAQVNKDRALRRQLQLDPADDFKTNFLARSTGDKYKAYENLSNQLYNELSKDLYNQKQGYLNKNNFQKSMGLNGNWENMEMIDPVLNQANRDNMVPISPIYQGDDDELGTIYSRGYGGFNSSNR